MFLCGYFMKREGSFKLLSSLATCLQTMVDVCAEFGQEHSITFNKKKSVCFKFGSDSQTPDILLNSKVFQWESKVDHVGNYSVIVKLYY